MNPEQCQLRVSRLHYPVTALGPGRRLGIWVQGCGLACPGCLARDTWDATGGRLASVSDLASAWQRVKALGATGMTVTGGEPLDQAAALAAIIRAVRDLGAKPAADVLVYTGYTVDEAAERGADVLALADAIITGRFLVSQPTRLIWRGSANQQLLPLSPLGRERFGPFIDHEPAKAPIQFGIDASDVWFAGVPRSGDLGRLERALRAHGLTYAAASWRP